MRQSVKKIVIIIVSVFTLKFQSNTVNRVVKQTQARTARTRFSVTTCLFFNPNNRARSPSTLRAVDAKTDTPQKGRDKDENRWENMIFKILMSILSTRSIRVAMSGWEMRPTPRSVMAKHWNNSFVGGWIEVTLRRAIRIRMLPRNAVMEKQYLQLLSQCINLHERLQKAVSSSQWRFRLPSSSPFFLLLLRDEVPYFDCFTKSVLFRYNTQGFYVHVWMAFVY